MKKKYDDLRTRLEAAEKSDAESIAMYRKARDERDALRVELNEIRYGVAVAHDTIKALRVKIAELEQQAPVAKVRVHQTGGNAGLAWSVAPLNDFDSLPLMRDGDRLYALPGARSQCVPSVPGEIERDVLRACCGTFHGSRHRITCERYKGKKAPEAKP